MEPADAGEQTRGGDKVERDNIYIKDGERQMRSDGREEESRYV